MGTDVVSTLANIAGREENSVLVSSPELLREVVEGFTAGVNNENYTQRNGDSFV